MPGLAGAADTAFAVTRRGDRITVRRTSGPGMSGSWRVLVPGAASGVVDGGSPVEPDDDLPYAAHGLVVETSGDVVTIELSAGGTMDGDPR